MGAAQVLDALVSPLDERTRRRYDLKSPDERAEAARKRDAEEKAVAFDKTERQVVSTPRPDAPQTPWQMNRDDWMKVGKRTFKQISEDRVMSVAGGVTFFGLLALFPALTALVSIYGLFADPATITRHLDMLDRLLPSGALDIIRGQVESITASPGSALSAAGLFGLALALYSAMGGTKAVIEALNVAFFKVETRNFFKLNLVALAFTLAGIVGIITMLGLIAVIPLVIDLLPLGALGETLVTWLRWPLILVLLTLALAALYKWAPNKADSKWEWISPGAVFATLGLIIASALFSWYASNFANYNETYGTLGAVVGLMMWLWIASMVVMVGAEINSEIERQLRIANGKPVPGDPVADEQGKKKKAE